ncbi:hypothetical protein AVEN_241198-1 [Araneus ventricosus]|uniref:Uncharacterized protein n=1 Tax=Araneus ventricosus TaxID=182803 RepID=A0A4Y2D195_ARAVE|nr:hypothetical protein AVEN_241198-1 [Araneus ventricosus]
MLVGPLSPAGPVPALHPSWVGRASVRIFASRQREDVWGSILVTPVGLGVGFRTLTTEPNPTGGTRIDPLATVYDSACGRPIHGGYAVELGFEPGTLRPQIRDLTTMPTRP